MRGGTALLMLLALGALGMSAPPSPPPPGPPGKRLTLEGLRALAIRTGFADWRTAAAIAMAESTGDPHATNIVSQAQADTYNATHPTGPRHGPERSFGLWQVNTLAHPTFDEHLLLDPEYNARAALQISHGGTDFHAWATFNDGSYRRFMS